MKRASLALISHLTYQLSEDMKDSEGSRRVTIRDIAESIGVSHVTVSLALRGQGRISEKMRKKVRAAAEEMGYQPDPMLSALAKYRSNKGDEAITSTIAWINGWPDPAELRRYKEFDLYWKGAMLAARKFGYRLEEFSVGAGMSIGRLHQILSTRGVNGILLPPHSEHPEWEEFPWEDYSVVRFGRSLRTPNSHLVTADQVANTVLSFRMALERGYSRIGFATDETRWKRFGHMFEAGYLVAQRLVDEGDRLEVFAFNDHPKKSHQEALKAWYEEEKPDAVITNMKRIPALFREIGIDVPGDLGLIGTSQSDLPISAGVDQFPEEIGRVGTLTLISLINDGAKGNPSILRQNLVEGGWVDGESLPERGKSKRSRAR